MSNEKSDDGIDESNESMWERMPREARSAVYEHLRALATQHQKDGALATLVRSVATKDGAPTSPMPIEVMHQVAAVAFLAAIETLEDADPDLCPDCGEYHDDEYVHVPSTNPKDLS